ncbi:MAG TPA: LysR substrate-binding domain-containing protein [Candidatus Sulfopaludibacter sp.]|nr:LysR substrate-binding domain-containing protein [Candidatus Sulfopaludibacter sp.]
MLAEMELRHLRYFVAVAEEENVSRAALKLHVSQPGISRQIHDLEDEIGFQLFERSAKSVRLTGAGKVFLTEARVVLQHAEDAVKKARVAAGGTNGEINVGYAPSLTIQILPQALRKFHEKFPGVRVVLHDLSTEEMLSQIGEKKLQVALTVRPPAKLLRGLNFEELARYAACVAVAPKNPLAKSKFVSLEQISREQLIAYTRKDYPEYHAMLEKLFAPVGRKPRIIGEHDGVSSIVAAVEAGRGFALVPSCVACMVGPRLKLLSLRPALPPIPVGAIWLKDNQSEQVMKFIAAARKDS